MWYLIYIILYYVSLYIRFLLYANVSFDVHIDWNLLPLQKFQQQQKKTAATRLQLRILFIIILWLLLYSIYIHTKMHM
jgi:hypothetical protein